MVEEKVPVTIRRATPADAGQIARIHVDSWREAYAGIMPADYLAELDVNERENRWLRALEAPAFHTWLAFQGDAPLGFITIAPDPAEDAERGDLELRAIYLQPHAWGRGVARELLREAFAAIPSDVRLSLWVLAENERAQHFYRRHGLVADGVERIEEYGDTPLTEVRYIRAPK